MFNIFKTYANTNQEILRANCPALINFPKEKVICVERMNMCKRDEFTLVTFDPTYVLYQDTEDGNQIRIFCSRAQHNEIVKKYQ